MKNIWEEPAKTKEPFFVLAPMAGVTDSPFRQMIAKIGSCSAKASNDKKPDLFFTEFISTEMVSRSVGATSPDSEDRPKKGGHAGPPLQPILRFDKKEKPLIAQFFGCKPEQFKTCAQLALDLGFDGIDINVGCPDKKVQKQGAGSELIKNPELLKEILIIVREVVGDKIPVSIKTRLGYDDKNIQEYLEILKNIVKEGLIDAITIHGRTAKQGYLGEADWEMIGGFAKEIKAEFKKKFGREIAVIGNGDVKSLEQGKILAKKYGVDGVMIGREVLKNPFVFCRDEKLCVSTVRERLRLCLEHTRLYKKQYGQESSAGAMKKYYKAYLAGVSGNLVDKKTLMEVKSLEEAENIIKLQISNF